MGILTFEYMKPSLTLRFLQALGWGKVAPGALCRQSGGLQGWNSVLQMPTHQTRATSPGELSLSAVVERVWLCVAAVTVHTAAPAELHPQWMWGAITALLSSCHLMTKLAVPTSQLDVGPTQDSTWPELTLISKPAPERRERQLQRGWRRSGGSFLSCLWPSLLGN